MEIEDIPKKYGGTLNYEFGNLPNLDPKIKKHMSIESAGNAPTFLVASPIRWVNEGEDGEMIALSVGNLDGKQRKERIAVLHAAATRVATQSSNSQSQRIETTALPIRPAGPTSQSMPQDGTVSDGHAAPQVGAAFVGQAPSQSQRVPNGHITSESQPSSIQPGLATDLGKATLHEHRISNSAPREQPLVVNGSLPESKPQSLTMPIPPPIDLERTKTDFFTPPSDPSEAKQLA